MGKVIRIVGVVAALVVCAASATPYQEKGFRGGVAHRQLGPNSYSITAEGNGFTNRSTIVEYTHRRASELCPGGYDVMDKDANTETMRCGDYDCNKSDSALIVQCRTDRNGNAPPPTTGPGTPAALPRY